MRHLLDAAEAFRLEVVAVELPEGIDWVVPSVVHLQQNHYVAIVGREGEVYEVADPSFGRNKFSGAALWSEASGVCLVPARLIEGPWRLLADAELDGIVGRGYQPHFEDQGNQGGSITGFTLTYPNGIGHLYDFLRVGNHGFWTEAYLTRRINRQGYEISFAYPFHRGDRAQPGPPDFCLLLSVYLDALGSPGGGGPHSPRQPHL